MVKSQWKPLTVDQGKVFWSVQKSGDFGSIFFFGGGSIFVYI